MEFGPIKDVPASNLVAIQEALILGIRAPVRDSVHGLINYQYFAQVQEREKYWRGTARENEKGNSQQGREHFDAMQNTWPQRWLLLRRSTAPDLADYASPWHAQRFRNYCGTRDHRNVDEFGRNVKCRREEWGKAHYPGGAMMEIILMGIYTNMYNDIREISLRERIILGKSQDLLKDEGAIWIASAILWREYHRAGFKDSKVDSSGPLGWL
ncbi:hypothetical protein C8J57DRAFT_1249152 [Mycena rebaudengoi]|nr:hypothetical protein C8J57DRAFT_1249152 [Mycena rebaudengoi]